MFGRKMFDDEKRYFIYGAGDVAREVLYCLRGTPHNLKIESLIVSDSCVENGRNVDGIPVISCDDLEYRDDMQIIVAVLEKYRDEICKKLEGIGFHDLILMTFESDLWCKERGKAYALYRERWEKKPYILLQDRISCGLSENNRSRSLLIYVAKSHLDQPLRESVEDYEWEKDIQVGAALTKLRICDIIDSTGDNISKKIGNIAS